MSKALKIVGTIAGIASFIPGPHQPIAAAVAVAANAGAALTAKKPSPAVQGNLSKTTIGSNLPRPCLIGETFYGGARRHQIGYGGRVGKIDNPYLLLVDVYSACGPVEGLVGRYLDFVPLPMAGNDAVGYANGFLVSYHQLGQTPEAGALPARYPGAPGWGPDYRLSSYAAISWCLRFDDKGKVFAAGVPATGAVWRGVKCYDPRKDSTYPGGSGPHRWADPKDKVAFAAAKTTWEWTRCPGLNGLRYALGTWDRDETNANAAYLKTYGIGIPIDGIRVADFVGLANVCDANGWHCDGVIFEPGNRDENLKNILAAGGAERCWVGGRLALKLSAPRVALDTITDEDLANDDVDIGAMQGWEQRINTLTPEYRSPDHKWEYVPSTPVQIATYLAEDGEEKGDTRRYNMVQDRHQAAQLASYELLDARELGEIVLTCKPRLGRYGPGALLTVDLPADGLSMQPCVVLKRTFDPVEMTVEFVLRGETPGKHALALAAQGTAPPTPALGGTAAYDAAATNGEQGRVARQIIASTQTVAYPVTSTADTITVAAFSAYIDDGTQIMFPAAAVGGLEPGTRYAVLWDRSAEAYVVEPEGGLGILDPDNVILCYYSTALADGTYPPTQTPPGGYGGTGYSGGGNCPTEDMPFLTADADRSGPGAEIPAGDVTTATWAWTQHEHTGVWGAWRVTAVSKHRSPVMVAPADRLPQAHPDIAVRPLRASPDHRVGGAPWTRMRQIGIADGEATVVRITVAGAGTYVVAGVLSHNIKATGPEIEP